eukprot:1179965-Prorocentrum_minimum.AAC.5
MGFLGIAEDKRPLGLFGAIIGAERITLLAAVDALAEADRGGQGGMHLDVAARRVKVDLRVDSLHAKVRGCRGGVEGV